MRSGARLAARLVCLGSLLLGASAPEPPAQDRPNGFDLSKSILPAGAIRAGGPPRDGIRSVDAPGFVSPDEAIEVSGTTVVLGLAVGGEARAYPVHLLEWHQIVNDVVGGVPVVVSYDPLTGSPRAHRRRHGDRVLAFGVSGLIHNSSFLLYDRGTESLWLQWTGQAVAGPLAGARLTPLPVRQEVLALWLAREPETLVLQRPLPKEIDYRYSPYKTYWIDEKIPFPVAAKDPSHHPKELVVGLAADGRARAYLGSRLTAVGGSVTDTFAGRRVRIDYDTNLAAFAWDVPEGIEVTEAYWFAWKAFHPDTEVWQAASE